MVEKAIPQDGTLHSWPHHLRGKGKMASKPPCLSHTWRERAKREKQHSNQTAVIAKTPFSLKEQEGTRTKQKDSGVQNQSKAAPKLFASCSLTRSLSPPAVAALSAVVAGELRNWRTWELENSATGAVGNLCRSGGGSSCCRHVLRNSLKQLWIAKCSFSG